MRLRGALAAALIVAGCSSDAPARDDRARDDGARAEKASLERRAAAERDQQIAAQHRRHVELQQQLDFLNANLNALNGALADLAKETASAEAALVDARDATARTAAQARIDALKKERQDLADSIAATQRGLAKAAGTARTALPLDEKCLNDPLGC